MWPPDFQGMFDMDIYSMYYVLHDFTSYLPCWEVELSLEFRYMFSLLSICRLQNCRSMYKLFCNVVYIYDKFWYSGYKIKLTFIIKGFWHEIFSFWLLFYKSASSIGAISNSYESSRIYSNVKGITGVNGPGDKWDKCRDRKFSIFCLKTIGLQYILIEWIFRKH